MKHKLVVLLILLALVTLGWGSCPRQIRCPYQDGQIATWIGETEIINGHAFYVYVCPEGHKTAVPCD